MFIQLHDLDFILEPIYPEYIPLEDEHILSAEEQPLPLVVSPTVESLGYVVESDPKQDPEEYEDDETKDGPVDYPIDGGDNGDDDDGNSSGDDADDKDEDEEDEKEEEEEHLAPANSAVIIPTDEFVAAPEGIEPVIPPPSTNTATTGARIIMHGPSCITITTTTTTSTQAIIVDRRDDIPETKMLPRKSTLDAEARRRGIREVGYGIRDTWWVNLLIEDKIAYQETIQIVEDEAYATGEAWAHSIRLSQAVYSELQTHQERIMAPVTRQGLSTLPNNTNPNNMTLESIQAMIN
uniref:Reverse transcriptase domain-containing protein n=1 Tax=Tanacetum cinerariifolium TaxID=118510 RepID=A0A699LAN4_TANCI|nr:hypothetical protein [Tanacetum cinerariifolium]